MGRALQFIDDEMKFVAACLHLDAAFEMTAATAIAILPARTGRDYYYCQVSSAKFLVDGLDKYIASRSLFRV